MPNIDLSILNQRQTPAFYADVFANRPAAGFVGRIFVSTDTYAFYRDNGTGWDLIGGPGTGTVTGTGANGQVTFWNGASTITGSNDLFWDATNGHFGVNTNAPGTALDVHHDQPTVAILNQTVATNDVRIGFQNNGVGLWRIGAFYNAGANDFGIYDAVAAIQPVTVKKTTGQVLIGTSTVGSGKLVVASASSDNGIQIVGASAPSLRIDSAESGPTKRAGLGISTATNNFIQGSADRDFCIFNGSTAAASPILFGIYDAAAVNVQEAARISAARNFLIGTTTDSGYKLNVNGTAYFQSNVTLKNTLFIENTGNSDVTEIFMSPSTFNTFIDYPSGRSLVLRNKGSLATLTLSSTGAATFSSTLTTYGALYVGQTGVTNGIINSNDGMYFNIDADASGSTPEFMFGKGRSTSGSGGTTLMTITNAGNVGIGTNSPAYTLDLTSSNDGYARQWLAYQSFIGTGNGTNGFQIRTLSSTGDGVKISNAGNSIEYMRIGTNILIGTTTDNGQKFQVEGNARIRNTINLDANTTTFVSTSATIISSTSNTYGGLAIVWGADTGGNIFTDFIYYSLGTFNVLASQSISGGPASRTYSVNGSGSLLLTMGSGTYTIRYQAIVTA